MAVYGGHVWRTYLALGDLAREGPAFVAFAGFPPLLSDGVNKCLAAARCGSGVAKVEGLEDVLRELAERGFAAIPSRSDAIPSRSDPRAEVVSESNDGGVVPLGASAPGLPRAAWGVGDGRQVCACGLEPEHAAAARKRARARPASQRTLALAPPLALLG